MKFSEKLIKLRKENLLSQEELGEKLNVTRQTVSKWELGQTTPEISKLVEISKLFGVTLDELTDDKKIENEHFANNVELEPTKKNKIIVIILVGILILLLILGANKIFNTFSIKGFFESILSSKDNAISQAQNLFEDMSQIQQGLYNKANQKQDDLLEQSSQNQQDLINQAMQMQQNLIDQVTQKQEDLTNNKEFNKELFNANLEFYNGTSYGISVKNLIDKIVTNNKKEKDKIITIIYEGASVNELKEIQNLKNKIDDMTQYKVSFEYDEDGYIYQADIMVLN